MSEWKSTEPRIWKPQEIGEVLQGFVYAKSPKVKDRSAFYHIQDREQNLHIVFGSAVLDRGMQRVEEGQEVKITYKGTKDIGKKYPLKLFDVEYRDNPNNNVELSEEVVEVLKNA